MAVVKPAFTVVEHISSSYLSGNKYTVLTSSCGRHDEHHPLTPSPAPSFPHRDTASGTYPTGCCYSSRKQDAYALLPAPRIATFILVSPSLPVQKGITAMNTS